MKSTTKKIILRYKKADLDAVQKTKSGLLYVDTNTNRNLHCCETAYVEASNEKLEEQGLSKGSRCLVQYLVDLDTQQDQNMFLYKRNQYFMEEQDGDIIRWCHVDQIFGRYEGDNFIPIRGWVYCEPPKKNEERVVNGIVQLEKEVDTETKGYETTIRFIHPQDAEENGLSVGDRIICDRNSDARKSVSGEILLRVPLDMILGICQTS
jgi:hypothetical protein